MFACVFGAALLGMVVRRWLPAPHLSTESKDVVKLSMALVSTIAALVLGLLTASAKGTFDSESTELKALAAQILQLDRELRLYGPETIPIRAAVKREVQQKYDEKWSPGHGPARERVTPWTPGAESIDSMVRNLTPVNDTQREVKAQALAMLASVVGGRWMLGIQAGNDLPEVLLIAMVSWLSMLFLSFGLFAPRNGTVLGALGLSALAVSCSVFLILEMNRPFDGLVRISGEPFRFVLAHMANRSVT